MPQVTELASTGTERPKLRTARQAVTNFGEGDWMFRPSSENRKGEGRTAGRGECINIDWRRPRQEKFRCAFDFDGRGASARMDPIWGGGRPPAGYAASYEGRCRMSGGSACPEFSASIKLGIDPRSVTPRIANPRKAFTSEPTKPSPFSTIEAPNNGYSTESTRNCAVSATSLVCRSESR